MLILQWQEIELLPFVATVLPTPEPTYAADPDGFWPARICHYPREPRTAVYTRTMKPTGGEYWSPTLTPPVVPPRARVYGVEL